MTLGLCKQVLQDKLPTAWACSRSGNAAHRSLPLLGAVVAGLLAPSLLIAPVQAQTTAPSASPSAEQAAADKLLADQKWKEATKAYKKLLRVDAKNGQNWVNLGQAQHGGGDAKKARASYLKALDAGYQPGVRVHYRLARLAMETGNHDEALLRLEEIAKANSQIGRIIKGTADFAPIADNPRYEAVLKATTPCATDEYRAFDFWLGSWDVTVAGAGAPSAVNHITSAQQGCAVLENYTAGAFSGQSINFYDRQTKKWHQSWMGNGGAAVYLEGGLNDKGEMVLTDADLPVVNATSTINRVTWSPLSDGRVRQHWQNSTDGGKTWSTSFDGYYKKQESK